MRRPRPAIPRVLRLVLLAVLLAAVTGPAHAESARLLVSRAPNGPYADQLSGPLLPGAGRVVPEDQVRGAFWVKNPTAQPARTTVSVVNRGASNELTGGLTITVDAGGTRTTGHLPPDGSRCDLVVTGPSVAPGEVQRVGVHLDVDRLSGQQGMNQQFSLDVDVTLSHLGGSGEVATCGEQAAADAPADAPAAAAAGDADCAGAAVVTLTGTPRCVPSAVEAGISGGSEPRDPVGAAASGAVWLALGGLLLLAASRRRRTAEVPSEG